MKVDDLRGALQTARSQIAGSVVLITLAHAFREVSKAAYLSIHLRGKDEVVAIVYSNLLIVRNLSSRPLVSLYFRSEKGGYANTSGSICSLENVLSRRLL